MARILLPRGVSRRGLLLGAAAVGSGVVSNQLGMPFISRGLAAGPIKLGFIQAQHGPMATTAVAAQHGAKEALLRHKNTAAGQPLELVVLDEPDEAGAVANMKKLITEHKVAGIVGGTAAGPAMVMSKLAAEAKIPLIVHGTMYEEITGKNCNRWTYRVPAPFDVQYHALAPYLNGYGKKWFMLGENSMSGKEMLELARAAAKASGATEVGFDIEPVGSHGFAGAIDKIKASKPDVIVGCLMGEDVTEFLKAWKAAGMTGKIPFAQVGVADADVRNAGKEAATGVYTKTWHFSDPKLSREDKQFVEAYAKEFNGEMPGTVAWQSYIAMRSLIASIDKAESAEADKVRTAIDGFRRPSGEVILGYRDFDHQMMHRIAVLETKHEITDKYDWWDVEAHFPEKVSDLSKMYGTAEQNGCKMTTS